MGWKSKIKIFWSEHSDPILFYAIVVVVGIVVIRGIGYILSFTTKEKIKEQNTNQIKQESSISNEEEKFNQELIEKFMNYCRNNNTKEAYEMISSNCKNEKYNTFQEFINNYYKKYFAIDTQNKITEVELRLYKVEVMQSALETGIPNGKVVEVYYIKIEPENLLDTKLYVDYKDKS